MPNVEFFDWKLDVDHPVSVLTVAMKQVRADLPLDIHSALHLLIVNSGTHHGRCSSAEMLLHPGEIFLSAPWEPHCTLPGGGKQMLVINIDPVALKNFFFAGYEKIERLLAMDPAERLKYLNDLPEKAFFVAKLNQLAALPDTDTRYVHIWHGVLALLLACDPPYEAKNRSIADSRRFLNVLQKLGKEPLPLEHAAELCNLSASRFAALFKGTFGLSYGLYERLFRLNGAAAALRRNATFKEAAAQWGFCDKSHLARLLKKHKMKV